MVVRAAQQTLPGIDHVGVSVAHRGGQIETRAATDALVRCIDGLQQELLEGPGVYDVRAPSVVMIEHASRETRWPQFISAAVGRLGLRSHLRLQLYADAESAGFLNLYSTSMDVVAPETRCIAELFAGHAALTFTRATRDQSGEAVRFKRRLIARAIGVLEERYGLSRDRAYQYLVRASSHSDLELTEVAREVVGAQTEQSSVRG